MSLLAPARRPMGLACRRAPGSRGAVALGAVLVALGAGHCAPASPQPATDPHGPLAIPEGDPARSADPLAAGQAATWQAAASPLRVPLPDRPGWREVPGWASFSALEHAATQSSLAVRAWYVAERTDRHACEQHVRTVRDLPDLSASDEEPLAVPVGFDSAVRFAVLASADGTKVDGALVGFGARGKQCFAYLFTTTAAGVGAERVVADRLAAMRARSLARLELDRDTDPVPRAPHPALAPSARPR